MDGVAFRDGEGQGDCAGLTEGVSQNYEPGPGHGRHEDDGQGGLQTLVTDVSTANVCAVFALESRLAS